MPTKATTNALSGIIKMKQLLSLLLALMLSLPANADCSKPVTTLESGTPAPCRGFLFTPEKEHEVRLMGEDYDLTKQELDLKTKKIDLLIKSQSDTDFIIKKERDQSELWRKAAEDSTLKLTEKENRQGYRDWLMIFAGIALTVGAGYAVGQAHGR